MDEMDPIEKLSAQYFQQVDPSKLSLPGGLAQEKSQNDIYLRLFSEDLSPVPPGPSPSPPVAYQIRVLKRLLTEIENAIVDPEEEEIHDLLLSKWTTLITTPNPPTEQAQTPQLSCIAYTPPSPSTPDSEAKTKPKILTLESRNLILSSGTTGHRTWEAALHLGTYLSTGPGRSEIANKRVIEIGAGSGFLSFFLASASAPASLSGSTSDAGVKSVVATDWESGVVRGLKDGIVRNNLQGRMGAGKWEWGGPCPWDLDQDLDLDLDDNEGEGKGKVFDIGIGADLVYDTDILPLLVSAIKHLFDAHHIQKFLLAATLRNEETWAVFVDVAEKNGFIIECIPFESPREEDQTGFFHSVSIPVRTFRVFRPHQVDIYTYPKGKVEEGRRGQMSLIK